MGHSFQWALIALLIGGSFIQILIWNFTGGWDHPNRSQLFYDIFLFWNRNLPLNDVFSSEVFKSILFRLHWSLVVTVGLAFLAIHIMRPKNIKMHEVFYLVLIFFFVHSITSLVVHFMLLTVEGGMFEIPRVVGIPLRYSISTSLAILAAVYYLSNYVFSEVNQISLHNLLKGGVSTFAIIFLCSAGGKFVGKLVDYFFGLDDGFLIFGRTEGSFYFAGSWIGIYIILQNFAPKIISDTKKYKKNIIKYFIITWALFYFLTGIYVDEAGENFSISGLNIYYVDGLRLFFGSYLAELSAVVGLMPVASILGRKIRKRLVSVSAVI